MACVHRLEHIQGFRTATLTDNHALRAHTQGVDHQVANGNFSPTFNIGRARFKSDHMLLAQLQFGRIFNCDNALVVGNKTGQMLSRVVLPEPVPPETTTFNRPITQAFKNSMASAVTEPN
jgi:hypothetical protein